MSAVISFRLDKENPREERALEVIKTHQEKGYGIRHIITEALLRLDAHSAESVDGAKFDQIQETLTQVRALLEQMGLDDDSSLKGRNTDPSFSSLTDVFISSVKKTAKPGLKAD